jgi:hypothetical protein
LFGSQDLQNTGEKIEIECHGMFNPTEIGNRRDFILHIIWFYRRKKTLVVVKDHVFAIVVIERK